MAGTRQDRGAEKGYEVRDRRSFTPEGELKGEGADRTPAGSPSETSAPVEPSRDVPASDPGVGDAPSPRPIDFGTFILSLATAALFHLGDAHEEEKEPPPPNLPLARETIDILEMLHEKTRGNLSKDEAAFLEGILFDLRMRYVARTRKPVVA